MPRALVLNKLDNVATLIDSGKSGEACGLQGESKGSVTLLGDVPFGHKVCIKDTSAGQDILKYSTIIGKASTPSQSRTTGVESSSISCCWRLITDSRACW